MRTLSKKVFFIRSNKTRFGGAETYLSRLSEELSKYQIDHQIINSTLPKFLPSWLRVILFNFSICFSKKSKFYFSLDRVTCPDIYRAGDGVHKVFLSTERKSKTNLLHPTYIFLEKRCFNKSKCIVANSHMVKQQIIDSYGIQSEKIKIIYNGVKSKEFDYKKSFDKLSKEFMVKKNQSIILYVGSGFKRKGVKEFLQIISKLRTPNIKAFVIGKEKDIDLYINLSQQLHIDNQVVFTGPREDVDDFYAISDIFLFPTHYEPFSNVVLEAMNFENVVFTTRQNGASEILDKRFIMDSPDDNKVVKSIDNLLSNEINLKEYQIKNREKSKLFSIEKNLDKTLEVINDYI